MNEDGRAQSNKLGHRVFDPVLVDVAGGRMLAPIGVPSGKAAGWPWTIVFPLVGRLRCGADRKTPTRYGSPPRIPALTVICDVDRDTSISRQTISREVIAYDLQQVGAITAAQHPILSSL